LEPFISPQVNAMFQLIILVLLIAGIGMKWRKKLSLHGMIMLVAVILNLFSFVLIMLPSLLRTEIIITQPLQAVSIVALIHSSVGLVVMILGIWLVASWHLQSSIKNCFKNKRLMRLTSVLWLVVLLMGFLLYYLLYVY
jgi:uncharacterized membrane protein YozB (DUF420 family)